MKKVIEWCTHHKNDAPSTDNNDDSQHKKSTDIDEWDQEFLQVDNSMLFDIILVRLAHYDFCHTFMIIAD
jgi:S-phase kinase-associated protein 1